MQDKRNQFISCDSALSILFYSLFGISFHFLKFQTGIRFLLLRITRKEFTKLYLFWKLIEKWSPILCYCRSIQRNTDLKAYIHIFFHFEKENIQSAKHEFSWNLNKNKFTFWLDTGCLCSIANESLAGKKIHETTRFFVFLLANNLNTDINLLPFIEGLLEKKNREYRNFS